MEYTFMVGNGFDVGLVLKTRYSDFIQQYVNFGVDGQSLTEDIESILKRTIRRDIETWADAERAFAELPFSTMFPNRAKFHKILLELLVEFKTSLNEYLLAQVQKVGRRQIGTTTSKRFFAHMVESLFAGMPSWLQEKELRELVYGEENPTEPNVFNFVNFNYTDTFDRLVGVKTLEPTDDLEIEGDVKNVVRVNILGSKIRFFRHHLIHVHGAFDTQDALFGVSELQQIKDNLAREFSLLSGYLIKSQTDLEMGNGSYEKVSSFLDDSYRVVLFGLSMGVSDKHWWQLLIDKVCSEDNFRIFIFPFSVNPFPVRDDTDYRMLQYLGRRKLLEAVRTRMADAELNKLSQNIHKITVLSYGPYKRIDGSNCMCDPLDLLHFRKALGIG